MAGGSNLIPPDRLFYTCTTDQHCEVSQSMREHFKNNGMLAVDVYTNDVATDRRGDSLVQYAPDYNGKVQEYTVEKIQSYDTVGKAIKLTFNDNPNWYWIIGHISSYDGQLHNGQTIMTGKEFGKSGGCGSYSENLQNNEGVSTNCHVHIELWKDGQRVTYPETIGVQHDFEPVQEEIQIETAEAREPDLKDIWFTSYNAEVGQTDNSPCIGAAGVDQCRFVTDENYRMELIGTTEYIEPIALSQNLVGRHGNKAFTYFDIVYLKSEDGDDRCNKKAVVLDTMNKRYTWNGDLFFMNRGANTSCTASVYKI